MLVRTLTRTLVLAALVVFIVVPPTGNSATPGLVAAFAFDEGAGSSIVDASGTGNNGTAANTTWAATGKYGKALSFNGTSSRVTVADAASLHLTGSMTLEAWVSRSGNKTGWRDLVYKGDDNYYLSASSSPNNRPAGRRDHGAEAPGRCSAPRRLPASTWTHLAVTYDGTTVRLYVNGAQVSSLAKTGNLTTSTNPLTIGSDPIYGQYFQGMIDDVRVYNVALTSAQIQTDMATPVAAVPDSVPPSAPGTLTASAINSGRIDLSWGAATDNVAVAGYRIERCTGAGCSNFVQIAAPPGTGTTYSDTSVASGTSYSYRVRAADAVPNLGPYSNNSTAVTPAAADTVPPSAPGTLTASAINSGRIDLSWGAATDNVAVAGYRIERCTGAGCSNFVQIAAPPGTGTTYSDTSVASGTSYSYRVRAADAVPNLGPYSNNSTAVTPAAADTVPPSAPGTLTASAINSGRIDLSWGAATDNVAVAGYWIERCQGAGCSSFAQIATTTGTGTTYSDTSVAPGTSYSYRVRAADAVPNLGPYSNTATAATPSVSAPTPVAAFAFDEVSGTTVVDASGNGNTGTAAGTTRVSTGRYGPALDFNGTSSLVTVADAASLRLTTAMTLEAWVDPTAVNSAWRDVIYKGDDNYYLEATSTQGGVPAGGGTIGTTYGTSALAPNTWTHLAVTYDKATVRLYVNGTQVSTVAATANLATAASPLAIGGDPLYGQYFKGLIDEVRIYNVALSGSQIQTDMVTPVLPQVQDPVPPTVSISSPSAGAQVSDIVNVVADASDDVGVAGVQFFVDGLANGPEDPDPPYGLAWDTRAVSNGAHTLTARARDAAGNLTTSSPVTVNVANASHFQNEVLATGFTLPTAIKFLPDGRMLVVELAGTIKVLPPPYTQPDPTPFLQLTNIGSAGVQQGIYDIALDPDFTTNHYYYVFYTLGSPNRDRLSRFTANASLTGTIAGSEQVLYQDPQDANAEHHGGAINFGNDGKLYFTTGEHFDASAAQSLSSPRGKIHRINKDGTIPTDNPFYDGSGPHVDSIWALGLRNPYRAYYDAPTGRLFVGDVGGNDYSTATEEVDLGAAGANYGWPNCESNCVAPYTNGIYSYAHNGRDAAITGGFVYHGSQFPGSYEGAYFFADYTQNWIKFLTFDSTGKVNGVFNFEPLDGSVDGPYGDIVYLTEGPDGALYYLDLGYSDISGTFGVSKIRRIRYLQSNQAPIAVVSSNTTSGAAPLTVNFSSAGSSDPEGQPLSYSWTFGDGSASTAPNPSHTYAQAGQYTARLSVSDGTNTTISTPIVIKAGNPPTPTILSPQDGITFKAGDVISFSGAATDPEDGTLPASAYTWNIDFLHEGHVHPGIPQTGVRSGTFTIPTSGHDFSGNTRYRVALTVTDSDGLTSTSSVIIWPQKVNLTFATVPPGLTLYLDGIAKVDAVRLRHARRLQPHDRGSRPEFGNDGLRILVVVGRRNAAAHARGACYRRQLHRDLQRRLAPGDARLRPGCQLDAPDLPDDGRDRPRPGADGRQPERRRGRLEQLHLEHHLGDRQPRERLPARRADDPERHDQPGDLLRQEHHRRRQHGHGRLQRCDAVRRRTHRGVLGARPGKRARRHVLERRQQRPAEQRRRNDDGADGTDRRRRHDDGWLHGRRKRLHDPHHHHTRCRHPRRSCRGGHWKLQRHRRPTRSDVGDATRRLPRRWAVMP